MALKSSFRRLNGVRLPYKARQLYMGAFELDGMKMPEGFEDYAEAVRSLVEAAGARKGTAYLTVDEKLVKKGQTQRKPKPHVDGCFIPGPRGSFGTGWGHGGGWNHSCNIVPDRMSVIVASSVAACRAWEGEFDAKPREDGDLSHIEHMLGEGTLLDPNVGYLLSPDCIHESLPVTCDVNRSFMRIALPVSFNK